MIEGTVTFTSMGGLIVREGDRVRFQNDPNALRRYVGGPLFQTSFTVKTYRRASKGYRRHLRKAKAARR